MATLNSLAANHCCRATREVIPVKVSLYAYLVHLIYPRWFRFSQQSLSLLLTSDRTRSNNQVYLYPTCVRPDRTRKTLSQYGQHHGCRNACTALGLRQHRIPTFEAIAYCKAHTKIDGRAFMLSALFLVRNLQDRRLKRDGKRLPGTLADLVACFARIDSHDSREAPDSRESEIRVIRANRPDAL